MTATLLNGKQIAEQIKNEIKTRVLDYTDKGYRAPGLAVILVGDDEASAIYVKNKIKVCEELGFVSQLHRFITTTTTQLLILIEQLNHDVTIDGILIQLPLSETIDTNQILDAVNPEKDVDGFHAYNIGRLCQNRPYLRSCTPYGVVKLLQAYHIETVGKHAVVVGASNIVGRPMMMELLNLHCTVSITHIHTIDLASFIKNADIIIVAVGKANLIKGEWIKSGAVVIDVGINRLSSGKLTGDVEFDVAYQRAGFITPVPGGVGPMTIAVLMQNTLQSYQKREELLA